MSKKITDLSELTTPANDDLLVIVDASESVTSSKTKKIKLSSIVTFLGVVSTGNFDAYDEDFTYLGGEDYYVDYNNNIYKFISPTDQTGVTPGTDNDVWIITSSGAFAHEKNKDQYLDFGGANQTAAEDIFLLDGTRDMEGNIIFANDGDGLEWAAGSSIKESSGVLNIVAFGDGNISAGANNDLRVEGGTTNGSLYLNAGAQVQVEKSLTMINDETGVEWASGSSIIDYSGQLSVISGSETFTFPSQGGELAITDKVFYPIAAIMQALNPADSTTYYIGCLPTGTTTDGEAAIPLRAGTIDSVYVIFVNQGTLGSNETSSVYLRVNTTDTLISSSVMTNTTRSVYSLTGLSTAVTGSDNVQIKWITPAYGTNPTSVRVYAVVNLKLNT